MRKQELALAEIEGGYPDQWVLVEETAWDAHGNPVRGTVQAHSHERRALGPTLQAIRRDRPQAQCFIFYTGEKIPANLTVVL